MSTWKSAFTARTDLNRYGDNAIGLFALALRFGLEDLETVAAESLTDGSDDKKVDLVYIDRDESVAVIAQCYTSTKARDSAPANKASDLNTAVAWLLQRSIDDLPERLRSTAAELRECLIDGSVADLHVWYVHNLPESSNVHNEILTVESSLALALKSAFPGKEIGTQVLEVGNAKLDEWYADTQSPILVTDHFTIPIPDGFQMRAANWDAYVTAIPAKFLYTQYRKHKARLFSANVRDYLGSRKTDANINYGIKRTAADTPGDFWVYNNGLTLLVNDYTPEVRGARKYLKIHGLSIVNGAQTTGALGSLDRSPHQTALVPVRVVKTTDSETIFNIIQYNNSQNKIAAADFRSEIGSRRGYARSLPGFPMRSIRAVVAAVMQTPSRGIRGSYLPTLWGRLSRRLPRTLSLHPTRNPTFGHLTSTTPSTSMTRRRQRISSLPTVCCEQSKHGSSAL